jgi:hypothetical protein
MLLTTKQIRLSSLMLLKVSILFCRSYWSLGIIGHPIVDYTSERIEQILKYVVKVKITDYGDAFTGLIIKSQTGENNLHILVNLHSFYGISYCYFVPCLNL